MFWNAIVTSDRQPKHRNPAQLRSRGLDQVRPADCVERPAHFRYFRTTRRRTPLRPPAGIREEIKWRANRRTFLSYLGSAPMVTAFAGTSLLSTEAAFAESGPLDASARRH